MAGGTSRGGHGDNIEMVVCGEDQGGGVATRRAGRERKGASAKGGGEGEDRAAFAAADMLERTTSERLEPGIDYSLAECKGRWAYMNDEGTSHIQRGYRIGLSASQCVRSMFQIHNETINVWSHLGGGMLFIFLCVSVISSPHLLLHGDKAATPTIRSSPSPFVCKASLGGGQPAQLQGGSGALGVGDDAKSSEKCFQAEEKHVFEHSSDQFEAARAVLQHAKAKLPGLKQWKEVMESRIRGMRKEMADEAHHLQEKLDKAVAMLDSSVEKIKGELAYLSHASMEGCISCWAELVTNLNLSRDLLLEQLASVSKMSGSLQAGSYLGLSPQEWADYTAHEISGISHSLNGGIKAARTALKHASSHMTDELKSELFSNRFNGLLPFEAQHGLQVWPIVVFLLSACFCLFTSASYHLFNCHSRQLNDVLLLLDYVGISVLIAGSFYPPIFYGFYCKTSFLYTYLAAVSIISVSSAIVGVYSGLNPSKFWRLARVLCYSANACFGILPCAHLAILQFSGEPSWPPAIIYIGAMLGIYAFGTAIYTFQFPERYFPGTFDYFFSSHQLWHILVFAAAFLHYFCAVGHYRWRSHAMECPVA